MSETDEDIFIRTGQNQEPLVVTLTRPDGADFTQRARDISGSLSRLDGVTSDLLVITDGFSIDEASAMLTEHAERFGLEQLSRSISGQRAARISSPQRTSVASVSSSTGRQRGIST